MYRIVDSDPSGGVTCDLITDTYYMMPSPRLDVLRSTSNPPQPTVLTDEYSKMFSRV